MLFRSVLKESESTRWNPLFADINVKINCKSKGIDAVIKHYGFDISEVMAFGDGGNDVKMIKHAAYGVVMGNAVDEAKEVADFVTTSVDEGGIANALKHYGVI